MATITARDQAAVEAARKILSQGDWLEPLTIKAELEALRQILAKSPKPDLSAEISVAGQIVSVKDLLENVWRFNRALANPLDIRLFADLSGLKNEHLIFLEKNLAEIIAPPVEAEKTMDAVIPTKAKLEELKEILEAQAKTTADMKERLGRPSQLKDQIKHAQEIAIRAQLLRVAVSKNLFIALTESSYIRDLQAIYGKEAVNRLLAQRIDLAVSQSITALTLNQLGLSDPSTAAVYFAAQLEKNLKSDPNLAVALAKIPKSSRKNVLTDVKNLAEDTIAKIQPAAQAFRAEQDSSPIYRVNAENIARGEVSAALVKSGLNLTNKQASRLTDTLTRYFDQPDKQLQILKRIFPKITLETGQEIVNSLQPAISVLAGSSDHPTVIETISQTSLISLARTNPGLFPFRLTAAIRGKWLSTVETAALTIRLSQQLKVSPDYVVMKLAGITSQELKKHLDSLIKGAPVLGLPTQPPLKPDNPVFQRLNNALPEMSRLDNAQEEFQFNPAASSLNLQNSWHSLTRFFDVGKAIRFNIGRLPPVGRMTSSIQAVFSGLRVRSGAANSMFNFFSFVQRGVRAVPSIITAPFRAIGSAVSAGWGKVKTWAGTQIKAGLAKAGAWLAKKGVTAAATKLGLMAVGKGAAALLAQAAPVVGQVVGALTLLSILGDVGKFVWDHKKEIGAGLAGMFFLGQMLLAKVIGFLGSAAWTLGGALTGGIIGFMVGGPVGAAVGSLVGGTIGYLISSGAIGSAIAGIGTWLGSAAAGISSFIGALSAPSLVVGLGSTIATVGVSGLLIGTTLTVFFTQPRTNSAMFVPTDSTPEYLYQLSQGGTYPSGIAGECLSGGVEITQEIASRMSGGNVRLLPDSVTARSQTGRLCIKPTAIVMHWSAGSNDNPEGNSATYNTLVSRNLACQLGVDTNNVELWQPFYENQVEMAWCANSFNAFAISNEMAGSWFTENPPPPNLDELELGYQATCTIMQQYQIPWCQVYGHFEVPDSGGKIDPGEDFLYNIFIPEIKRRCPTDTQNICN